MNTPEFLTPDAPPVLVFGGKGGVGKTTTAAASAIAIARACPDEKIMIVSTDPAHSLCDALADIELPENLRVEEIDANAEHTAFMNAHGEVLRQIASRGTFLDDGEIERFLDLSLPGVDELMCFIRLARWFEEEEADRYIVDTAPTGHALRLLGMPEMIEGWLGAIDALLGKHRYMSSVFGGGGSDPVEAFVDDITQAFENIGAVLSNSEYARFVPVFNAESLSINETSRLLDELENLEIDAPELVVNRLVPADATGTLADQRQRQHAALSSLAGKMKEREIFGVPVYGTEPRGSRLESHFDRCGYVDAWLQSVGSSEAAPESPIGVSGSVPLPSAHRSISLFAGKGGVGKTTMSCAAAIAQAASGQRTLLVSTDPAGSLGDAFDTEIGPDPVTVAPGLDVVQLDAERELQALKTEYADELEAFLDGLAMDLSFDREALENLLELAPTGIDEVMALVRMTEILEGDGYASLVIDTAPTGHTLRLLELPALVQSWLEEIFSVLVHYENVVRLPRVNERLLRLSKGLKSLQKMLADREATSLVAVTIPTRLGVAETERLLAGCERLGIPVAGLVVNQVTPLNGDGLAAELSAREQPEVEAVHRLAGSIPVAVVDRGGDLRRVDVLRVLSELVFQPASHSARKAA